MLGAEKTITCHSAAPFSPTRDRWRELILPSSWLVGIFMTMILIIKKYFFYLSSYSSSYSLCTFAFISHLSCSSTSSLYRISLFPLFPLTPLAHVPSLSFSFILLLYILITIPHFTSQSFIFLSSTYVFQFLLYLFLPHFLLLHFHHLSVFTKLRVP